MLNTVPRLDITSFSEIENEETMSELVRLLKGTVQCARQIVSQSN